MDRDVAMPLDDLVIEVGHFVCVDVGAGGEGGWC